MKQRVMAVTTVGVFLFLFCFSIAFAADMNWGSGNVYDPDDVLVVSANNWLHEFVLRIGAADTISEIVASSGNDTVVFSSTTWDAGGGSYWYHDTDASPSLSYTVSSNYYTRIWDSTTGYGNSTNLAMVYNETAPNPAAAPQWSYPSAAGDIHAGDWQPVPEPGTLALMGVGVLVVAARRRLKKRA